MAEALDSLQDMSELGASARASSHAGVALAAMVRAGVGRILPSPSHSTERFRVARTSVVGQAARPRPHILNSIRPVCAIESRNRACSRERARESERQRTRLRLIA